VALLRGPAFNAQRNVRAAAIAQGKQEWYDEIANDPVKMAAVVRAYMAKVSPEVTGISRAKKGVFCIATYQDISWPVSGLKTERCGGGTGFSLNR